ncbi:MAG: lasso peptide biosynthesis B2 protein [Candidatus Wallbacteria bacterium]|nr:lasso peptide biosynthesis B2 protein [Candidatus Wallbacteria bacterium]
MAAEAFAWLGLARVALGLLPFRVVARALGKPRVESRGEIGPGQAAAARRLGWAIEAASRRTPWESTCLIQALAAQRMLRTRGIGSTLYLGVRKGEAPGAGSLAAHAWLRCGSLVLTGERAAEGFTVVGRFGFDPS